ncbi:hypothetical protein ACSTJV_14230 [Vibrio parahaemolyticus]|nr:hypothetical protein [Vibrio parahaemolyticus]
MKYLYLIALCIAFMADLAAIYHGYLSFTSLNREMGNGGAFILMLLITSVFGLTFTASIFGTVALSIALLKEDRLPNFWLYHWLTPLTLSIPSYMGILLIWGAFLLSR